MGLRLPYIGTDKACYPCENKKCSGKSRIKGSPNPLCTINIKYTLIWNQVTSPPYGSGIGIPVKQLGEDLKNKLNKKIIMSDFSEKIIGNNNIDEIIEDIRLNEPKGLGADIDRWHDKRAALFEKVQSGKANDGEKAYVLNMINES